MDQYIIQYLASVAAGSPLAQVQRSCVNTKQPLFLVKPAVGEVTVWFGLCDLALQHKGFVVLHVATAGDPIVVIVLVIAVFLQSAFGPEENG